jgi:hypothetical membrane protein
VKEKTMLTFFQYPTTYISFSIAGGCVAVIGTIISALAYRGKRNEKYSPLNHFISELGEIGVSRLAWVFNLGLILSGLCLIPACIALGLILPGFFATVGMLAGVVTAVALSLVGVFPMNNLKSHGTAAITFFRGGLLMVLAFSVGIAFQQHSDLVLPRIYSLAGLPAILAFGSFLLMMGNSSTEEEDSLEPMEVDRPRVWIMPVVEWAIFLTIVAWFLLIAIGLLS